MGVGGVLAFPVSCASSSRISSQMQHRQVVVVFSVGLVGLINLGWVWPQSRLLFGLGSGGRRPSTSDISRLN